MEDKFDNINQFCSYSCNNCNQDWYCPGECELLLKARKMPFEKINKKWIEHDGDLVKVWRYIKHYKLTHQHEDKGE